VADNANVILRSSAEWWSTHDADSTNDQAKDIIYRNNATSLDPSRHSGQMEIVMSSSDQNLVTYNWDVVSTTTPAYILDSIASLDPNAVVCIKHSGYVDEAKTALATGNLEIGLGGAHGGSYAGIELEPFGYIALRGFSSYISNWRKIMLSASTGNIWSVVTAVWN